MTYHIGICDDETLQIKINSLYVKDIANRNDLSVTTVGFTSSQQLLEYLKHHTLHVVFMDIDMGGPSGISAAIKIFHQYPDIIVIFITGHREFAIKAYDIEALGYILKPVDISKLERLLKKALIQIDASSDFPAAISAPSLVVNINGAKIKIPISEILYIERIRYHSVITTLNETYQVYESITALEEKMKHSMIRINQSELIQPSAISTIKGYSIHLKNGQERTLSRKYKKAVLETFLNK